MRLFPKLNLHCLALCIAIVAAGGCKKSSKPAEVSTTPGGTSNTTENSSSNAAENIKVISARASFTPGAGAKVKKGIEQSVFVTADGKLLAMEIESSGQSSAQIWDISATPKKLHEYKGRILALSPDGKRMVRIGRLRQEEVADVETGAKIGGDYIQGSAEYYSILLSWRAGVIDAGEFLKRVNGRSRNYYQNPLQSLTLQQAEDHDLHQAADM